MRNLEFSLDWIFQEEESQEDIYAISAHDRVTAVLAGYNATLIAYGQTVSSPCRVLESISAVVHASTVRVSHQPLKPHGSAGRGTHTASDLCRVLGSGCP